MSLLATSFSDPPKKFPEIKNDYEKFHQKNFPVQKFILKLAPSIPGNGSIHVCCHNQGFVQNDSERTVSQNMSRTLYMCNTSRKLGWPGPHRTYIL